VRKPKVSVACIVVCSSLGAPGAAFAQDPGVHFDSGSPAGKEYAIPLAEGRAEGAGTTNQRAAATTPFGVGITPPGGGGGGGGDGGPPGSGGTGGERAPGGDGDGAKGSGAERREAAGGADRRGLEQRAIDERALSNAEAPVDTTMRTIGIAFGVLVAGILLALVLWWRQQPPPERARGPAPT
jgi:hypothetical protein